MAGEISIKIQTVLKDIKLRYVSVISLITDMRLATIKPSIQSISNRQVEDQLENLVLAMGYIIAPDKRGYSHNSFLISP